MRISYLELERMQRDFSSGKVEFYTRMKMMNTDGGGDVKADCERSVYIIFIRDTF